MSAEKGTEITITGEQFGTNKANVKTLIGSVQAETEIISLTDTKLFFELLAASKSGKITIERIKESKSATSSASFEFIPDYIVKTVGISRVMLALNKADKLVVADLWGGGTMLS